MLVLGLGLVRVKVRRTALEPARGALLASVEPRAALAQLVTSERVGSYIGEGLAEGRVDRLDLQGTRSRRE